MKVIREILILFMIPLMLVTKVIDQPVTVNFSPADILLVVVALLILIECIMNRNYRKELLTEKAFYLFLCLILIRGVSSMASYHLEVITLDYKAAVVANLKFLLSFIYVVIGISAIKFIGEKKVLTAIYISSVLFALTGLLSEFVFKFSWASANSRMISLANDPNVAGLVIILGVIAGFKLMDESKAINLKIMIWLSFLPLGLALILTGSRTAMLSFAIVIATLLINYIKNPKKLILTLSLGFILIATALFFDSEYLDVKGYDYLIDRVYYGTESASEFRGDLLQIANAMGKDHVLTGVGTGNYILNAPVYYEKLNLERRRDQIAHNTFFSLYAENGIIAFVLYGLLFIYFLYRQRNPYALMYLVLLFTYSLFFNVENIRVLWFSYGVYLASSSENQLPRDKLTYKGVMGLSLCIVTIGCWLMPVLTVPYSAEGQRIEVEVDHKVALYMELSNPKKKSLEVYIDGPQKEHLIINNRLGFYYHDLELLPGKYTFTIESPEGSIGIKRFDVITNNDYSVVDKLFSFNEIDIVKKHKERKLDVIEGIYKYDQSVGYLEQSVLHKNNVTGVNFNNEIALVSSQYITGEEGEKSTQLTFKKIGVVPEDYLLLFSAYPVNQEDIEKVKQLSISYIFERPLTTLEIGEEFTADWTFDTEGGVYMLYYGFYHEDKESGSLTRPYPVWFREGFVK